MFFTYTDSFFPCLAHTFCVCFHCVTVFISSLRATLVVVVVVFSLCILLCDKLCGAFSLVFLFPLSFVLSSEGCEYLLKVCTTKPFAIVIGGGDGSGMRSNGCFPYPFVYCLIAFYFLFAWNAYLDSWHHFRNEWYRTSSPRRAFR